MIVEKPGQRDSKAAALPVANGFAMGVFQAIDADGILTVMVADKPLRCLWLASNPATVLAEGDKVLVASAGTEHVVIGAVGPYRAPQPQKQLTIEATEVLTFKCGDVSIDMRAADGKLMLRGEDVLLRARGMQRIKAGSVNIN